MTASSPLHRALTKQPPTTSARPVPRSLYLMSTYAVYQLISQISTGATKNQTQNLDGTLRHHPCHTIPVPPPLSHHPCPTASVTPIRMPKNLHTSTHPNYIPFTSKLHPVHRYHAWNKLLAWTLTEYEKLVLIDSDTVAWNNADELFLYPEFAAVQDSVWPIMSHDYTQYFNTGMTLTVGV